MPIDPKTLLLIHVPQGLVLAAFVVLGRAALKGFGSRSASRLSGGAW